MSESDKTLDARLIKGKGWRQGSILPANLIKELLQAEEIPAIVTPEDLLIVVSHDCDVTNPSLSNEPSVELLLAHLLTDDEIDGTLLHGKNPRRLHFIIEIGGHEKAAETRAHERYIVARSRLLNYCPDKVRICRQDTIDGIVLWLVKRYIRAAFPDAFNERISVAKKPIARVLKTKAKYIREIFITLNNWGELPLNSAYQIQLVATMEPANYREANKRQQAQEALDIMEEKLHSCNGIEVFDAQLASEGDITLQEARAMERFDFDYLSIQDE